MTYQPSFPKINIWMFINDWNANISSQTMAKVYGLKTVMRVNNYVNKLRRDGHKLLPRKRGKAGMKV